MCHELWRLCLLLRALRRRGGGGESEDEETKMMSSESRSQFLLRRRRKKGIFDAWRGGTSDEECRKVPACRGWFCHVAYRRTCTKGIEKNTYPCWVLVMGATSGEAGLCYAAYACIHMRTMSWDIPPGTYLYWTRVSIMIGANSAMSLPRARSASSSPSRPNDTW